LLRRQRHWQSRLSRLNKRSNPTNHRISNMYSFKDRRQFLWVIGGILFVSYLWIGYHLIYGGHAGVVVCLIKKIIGIPCPGCGLTRAVVSFFNGDISTSIQTNPLVLIVAPALVVAPFALAVAPGKCYLWFQKAEVIFSNRTGIIILVLFFLTLWTYLIINDL